VTAPHLTSFPLATWEREGLKAALLKVGLPTEGIEATDRLFWRFETDDLMPVGFGGLEIHGEHAILRSVVTLPPVRGKGIGAQMVAMLEVEARGRGCRVVWLITASGVPYFGGFGYSPCDRASVPDAIRATLQFTGAPPDAIAMSKTLG
jgi:N-acetylglutamate synthase-like GNAT family acetyltransferase